MGSLHHMGRLLLRCGCLKMRIPAFQCGHDTLRPRSRNPTFDLELMRAGKWRKNELLRELCWEMTVFRCWKMTVFAVLENNRFSVLENDRCPLRTMGAVGFRVPRGRAGWEWALLLFQCHLMREKLPLAGQREDIYFSGRRRL